MAELTESTQLADDVLRETMEEEVEADLPRWSKGVAVSTLLMALFAAIAALFAGYTAHESLLERTNEIIEVAYLENDRVEVELLRTKHELITLLGEQPDAAELERIEQYQTTIADRVAEVVQEEALTLGSTQINLIFSVAATLLSIAISMSGMSVIVKHRWLWAIGLGLGTLGLLLAGTGVLSMFTR